MVGTGRKERFSFNPDDGTITPDPIPNPQVVNPVAQYSHLMGSPSLAASPIAARWLPLLANRYVFGDLAGNAGSARLFDTYLGNGPIFEFRMGVCKTRYLDRS